MNLQSIKGEKMSNLTKAVEYYKAVGEKNHKEAVKHIHPNIQFVAPLAKLEGKEKMSEAVKGFFNLFNTLTVKEKLSSGNEVMLVYEIECPKPVGTFRTAALLTFKDELIERLELFFDARPLESLVKK